MPDAHPCKRTSFELRKWPSAYAVADALGHGEALFLILYKDLCSKPSKRFILEA